MSNLKTELHALAAAQTTITSFWYSETPNKCEKRTYFELRLQEGCRAVGGPLLCGSYEERRQDGCVWQAHMRQWNSKYTAWFAAVDVA